MSNIMGNLDKIERHHIYNLDTIFNVFPRDAFDSNNDSAFIVKDTEENKKRWGIILEHKFEDDKDRITWFVKIFKISHKEATKEIHKKDEYVSVGLKEGCEVVLFTKPRA
jgi:hypothetical protein